MTSTTRLGEAVRQMRRTRRLSQTDLANKMLTQASCISRIENGGGNVTVTTLIHLAAALDCELEISLKPITRRE